MDSFGVMLREARQERKLSQRAVADYVSKHDRPLQRVMVTRWEADEAVPNARQFLHVCRLLDIRDPFVFIGAHGSLLNAEGRAELRKLEKVFVASGLFEENQGSDIKDRVQQFPVYLARVSAGGGNAIGDEVYEMRDFDDSVPSGTDYGLVISGDSMEPRYHDRQLVFVQKDAADLFPGEVGIFYLDGAHYIKQFMRSEDGVELVSFNEDYAPIQVGELRLDVQGRVLGGGPITRQAN